MDFWFKDEAIRLEKILFVGLIIVEMYRA